MRQICGASVFSFLIAANVVLPAQEVPKLEFEVASIRLSTPRDAREEQPYINGRRMGGPGSTDPERITYLRVPLDQILADAFDVSRDQIRGPDFIVTQRYDIAANVPAGASQQQAKQMLRNLLADRIHLAAHLETKIVAGYELRRGDGEFKLKEMATDPSEHLQDPEPGEVGVGEDGFPALPPGVRWGIIYAPQARQTRLRFRVTSMTEFASFLGTRLGSRFVGGAAVGRMWLEPAAVLDSTGISGRYDFTFDYEAFALTTPNTLPDVLSAIKKALDKQLGLKVVDAKVPVDTLVIDRIERIPTDN
jgi:uncharacterized protein (TIGR03435 family)